MPTTAGALPNCLIIGAAKAGTTSLFNILASHPQVFASPVKETRFFSRDDRFRNGLAWYQQEYFGRARDQTVRVEASPAYLTWSDKVAGRIRHSYGADPLTLVAILRDPVARAYSHYWHRVRLGHETLSFADAIAQEDRRLAAHWDALARDGNGRYGYIRAGRYATRLRPFLEEFDRDRLVFLLHEDLQPARFRTAVTRLLGLLGIDDTVELPVARLNTPTRARSRRVARMYWRLQKTSLRTLYTSLAPRRLRREVFGWLFPATSYPPIDAETERRLRAAFADEVERTQDLIRRDLSHWLPS